MDDKTMVISRIVYNKIIAYLFKQPFGQVAELIAEIQRDIAEQNKERKG